MKIEPESLVSSLCRFGKLNLLAVNLIAKLRLLFLSFKDQLFFQMPYLAEQRVESVIHD